ncbi:helix-turn-helix transcriptional regulator [Facilibium subflavum]|uniref:helix-turn-helix transcriptional regulator n=1 Tax=Facilibium subflavum TaxID=2219058 RepID=UPI0013C33AD1|nr:hypothetical protein [Facilibium subflavum]
MKKIYQSMISKYGAKNIIVLEYDLGVCKDSHCFLVGLNDEELDYPMLFSQLFDVTLFFYKQFRERRYKMKRIINKDALYFQQNNCYSEVRTNFDPFQKLQQHYHLTSRCVDYIKPLCLGLTAADIADLLGRSPRTVEKAIDNIRYILDIPGRQTLDSFLQMYYHTQVLHFLQTHHPYDWVRQWQSDLLAKC